MVRILKRWTFLRGQVLSLAVILALGFLPRQLWKLVVLVDDWLDLNGIAQDKIELHSGAQFRATNAASQSSR